jgi:hypothetical protein
MIDVVMYILLFAALLYFWYIERKDTHCPTLTASEAECKSEGGMCFSHTRPLPTDSCDTLYQKLHKAVGAEQASVKWRRAFVLSTLIALVVWGLIVIPFGGGKGTVYGILPDWKLMYLSVMIGYVILLGSFMYYSYHVFGVAETWMRDTIAQLQKQC